jgi:class 3 adenylate cyclase
MSLTFFVPQLARSLACEGPIPEAGLVRPLAAAALFVDISGFTALVDAVTDRFGDRGAERLQEMLNACFHPIVEAVESLGGQVLAFPGDAALCLWPLSLSESGRLAEATLLAARCALRVRDHVTRLRTLDNVQLQLRALVTAGTVDAIMAGGVDGHWTMIVAGPAIGQLSSESAGSGEVLMSLEAGALCRPFLLGSPCPSGWLLSGLTADAPLVPSMSTPAMSGSDADFGFLVPASVRARLQSSDERWLSEFRTVTVMFVVFSEPAIIEAPQAPIGTLQKTVGRFDGELNQVVVDDKGLTAVVVFGLFQKTHEDDARRAVATALALVDELRATAHPRIGIATGRVFTECAAAQHDASSPSSGRRSFWRRVSLALRIRCCVMRSRTARPRPPFVLMTCRR